MTPQATIPKEALFETEMPESGSDETSASNPPEESCIPEEQNNNRKIIESSKDPNAYLAGLTYLIVDDSRFNRKIVREALSLFGARRTRDAKDAIEAMKILSEEPVDLVLTDYEMPLVTGVELTRMIRKSKEVLNPEVPIIIISGFSEEYRIREAIAAGIEEYVTKPFAADKLLCHVTRALGVAHPALLEAS